MAQGVCVKQHHSFLNSWALGGIVLAAGLAGHCALEDAPLNPDGSVPPPALESNCTDFDHDGYGKGCQAGPDCDDRDKQRNVSCGAYGACETGTSGPCYVLKSVSQDALHCTSGTRTCVNGIWGSCNMNKEYSLELPETYAGVITGPVECNPCDPACAVSTDYPTDVELTEDNSEDVVYDPGNGGLTLDSGGTSGSALPDADGDGVPDAYDSCPANPACDGWGDNPATCGACAVLGDIFHELPFGGPAQYDPIVFETRVRAADVYFLMDNTASMGGEISNLQTALNIGNYLIRPQNCDQMGGTMSDWTAQYYPNATLSGAATFTQTESEIAHNWGVKSPPELNIDDDDPFSVRWTGTFSANGGNYLISATHDDAMRVFIDGTPYLAAGWADGTERVTSATVALSAGNHNIVVEYYEKLNRALAYFAISNSVLPAQYQGVTGAIRCDIVDAQFGAGYHDDFPYSTPEAYGQNCPAKTADASPRGRDKPYGNLRAITNNATDITNAINSYQAACGADDPESQLSALYAIASGHGIADTKGSISFSGMATVTPTTIDMSATPVDVTGAGSFADTYATAFDAGIIGDGPAKRLKGDSRDQGNDYDLAGCGTGSDAPDVVIKFTVGETRTVVISSEGTAFKDVVHLRDGTQAAVACDVGGGAAGDSLITQTLTPGLYYIVIDGVSNAQKGNYAIAIGSLQQETIDSPYHFGNRTNSWIKTNGTTTIGFADDMDDAGCAPEGNHFGRDVFYSFDVDTRTEMGVLLDIARNYNDTSDNNQITLMLYDASHNLLTCSERRGNEASFIGDLEPGTYIVRVDTRDLNSRGGFRLSIGPWATVPMGAGSDRWFAPPQTTCPLGTWGYPCFRDDSIPMVILMTDNRFHDGPSKQSIFDQYPFFAPDYFGALRALQERSVKVLGIHSGPPPGVSCDFQCLSGHYGEVCENQQVCDSYTCGDVTKCSQGKCWDVYKCNICAGGTHNEWVCEDEFICDDYDTETSCVEVPGISQEHLITLASDTGAVDSEGNALVYQINSDGSGMSRAVVRAVSDLAQGSRMNITLRINDNPGTPSVDERLFVESILAIPTAETNVRCIQPQPGDWFNGCLPGTNTTFSVGFANNIVAPTGAPQVFDFTIDTLGDGTFVLNTVEVRIVVPAAVGALQPSGSYWRDYSGSCVGTERPRWGEMSWTATFPAGTSIRWEIQTANEQTDLDAATPVTFMAPTTSSPVNVGDKLIEASQFAELPFIRVTAVLFANPGLTASPVLNGFELKYTCRTAE